MISNRPAGPTTNGLSQTKLHLGHTFVWTHIFPESSQVPGARSKHATCLHNGAIYLYGGVCGNTFLKDCWRFEPSKSLWTKLDCCGDAPPVLQEHTMVGYKDCLYIFGGLCGFDAEDETSLWILDLEKLTWRKQVIESEVVTPASRRGHSVVTHQGGMHLFGGHVDLKGSSNELWTLDFESLTWHISVFNNQDPIPPPRHRHSAVIHDNCLYIYGGLTNLQPLRDMWKWDFGCRQWSKVRYWQGPPALHGHTALTLGDSMMVYGGEDSSGAFRSDLWVFSYSSESWTRMSYKGGIIPSPMTHHTMEMDVPDSDTLFPHQEERSLSAPYLHRPSQSSLSAPPSNRPHSSPPYAITTRAKLHRSSKPFKNRVHPGDEKEVLRAMEDGCFKNSEDVHDDDDIDSGGDNCGADDCQSRIFIPVLGSLSASRENLLPNKFKVEKNQSAKKLYKSKITPLDDERYRTAVTMNGDQISVSSHEDVPVSEVQRYNQETEVSKEHRRNHLPQVRIEDYDGVRHHLGDRDSSDGFATRGANGVIPPFERNLCNNHKKFSEPPRVIHVQPKEYSDKIPLLSVHSASDDINLTGVSRTSHEHMAFVNGGFDHNQVDGQCVPGYRPRSNSLTLSNQITGEDGTTMGERHQSLNDLPNMAKLILQQRQTPTSGRPKLTKRSQTDHAIYTTAQKLNSEEALNNDAKCVAAGKGKSTLTGPVHLYVLGGQEPNVSSLHRYHIPLPILRCTIVPGKPTASQIQQLLR